MTHLPEIIHRLVRDSAFRTQFHENPYSALEAVHLSLDPATLEILCGCEHLFQIAPDQLWARLPSLCCAAVGGDLAIGHRVSVAWWLLLVVARILDDIEDADPFATNPTKMSTAQRLNVATGLQALAPLVVMERAYKRSKCLVGAHLPSR